eukprot:scaffold79733_cov18-Tisochrysis_lutea.AAC.2
MEATPEPRCKKFCSILSSRAQGYNDGLQATEPIAEGVMPRVVSPQNAKAANPEKYCPNYKNVKTARQILRSSWACIAAGVCKRMQKLIKYLPTLP